MLLRFTNDDSKQYLNPKLININSHRATFSLLLFITIGFIINYLANSYCIILYFCYTVPINNDK